jgi:hypothetical protein
MTALSPALLFASALCFSSAAHASVESRSFPLLPTTEAGSLGAIELIPILAEIDELRDAAPTLIMTGAPLPGGPVDLELRRLSIDETSRIYVNGEQQPGSADNGDLSIWQGKVRGRTNSDVLLGFSRHGCHGWIHDGLVRFNLLSSSDANGDWTAFSSRLVAEELIQAIGPNTAPTCSTDTSSAPAPLQDLSSTSRSISAGTPLTPLECPIAIETDYQLFQVFGSLPAMQNYVTMLITAMSERMRDQASVVLTYPYIGYYTDANDPWTSQDGNVDCGVVLNEFQAAWQSNLPNGAVLGHFLSGAFLGCGVAWVGTVCNPLWGFSLSCCINGGVTYPVAQGSSTWDFYVMAHELGHNLGSLHTHDYCPPLDECASNCNGTTQCTNQGTNLSYCHGCSGGMNNISTYYHPTVVGVMRAHVESSCVQPYCSEVEQYCWASENSYSTAGAQIDWSGSTSIGQNDFSLTVLGAIPGSLGLFFYGAGQTALLFGDGVRCVDAAGASILRLNPPAAALPLGFAHRALDFTQQPAVSGPGQIHPASTWNFQYWYRDTPAGLSGFNLSDALQVTFCP